MELNGIEYHRILIKIENLFQFKRLMEENNIEFIDNNDVLAETTSQIFYIKKSEINVVDNICLRNNIDIQDKSTSSSYSNFSLEFLPKFVRIPLQIILVLAIIYFFFLHNFLNLF